MPQTTSGTRVLVSPGYGAGFATWAENKKALAEDEELISMVLDGRHRGKTTYEEIRKAGGPCSETLQGEVEASLDFAVRAFVVNGDYVYCGGVYDLEVATVYGPYAIEEYDGFESLRTSEDFWS